VINGQAEALSGPIRMRVSAALLALITQPGR